MGWSAAPLIAMFHTLCLGTAAVPAALPQAACLLSGTASVKDAAAAADTERMRIGSTDQRITFRALLGLLTSLAVGASAPAHAQGSLPGYYSQRDLTFAPPGACRFGLYGWQNPAVLGVLDEGDMVFVFSDDPKRRDALARWGLFLAQPHHGFGVVRQDLDGRETVTDYRYSLALGDRRLSVGLGYGWSAASTPHLAHQKVMTLGMLARPNRVVSAGLVGMFSVSDGQREAVLELASRPLGSERVTLFCDGALREAQRLTDASWSVGAVVEPLWGVRVSGRYYDDRRVDVGLHVSLGRVGVITQVHRGTDDLQHATYAVRLGAWDRTALRRLQRASRYVRIDLNGPLKYRKYPLFDQSRTLLGVVTSLDRAIEDDAVAGVAVNVSGLRANPALIWELREKLRNVAGAGKQVVIFADNLQEWGYYLASVADHLVLDPQGMILLKGFVLGRTYLSGTLDALGIGVDEWRYFTHKSAFEPLSREAMSDGEREQLQRIADGLYHMFTEEVSRGRRVSISDVEHWINEDLLFLGHDALERGLVDRLGRWDAADEIVADLERARKRLIPPRDALTVEDMQDDRWGELPKIGVVYALGVCAMDEGISARSLVKDLERLATDPRIRAVVFRVDSPGGDALASDIVAEAVRRIGEDKPVVVSQGFVAASGGYWLSMYGHRILTSPATLTGSIGVIGGWFYNAGLKEKLRMTTDMVQAGTHADVGFGFRLPFLGVGVPDRNLSDGERAKVGRAIKSMYAEFVQKVAQGRHLSADSVAVLGEGRVWLGGDALDRGLVDGLGGLSDALALARNMAGIPAGTPIKLVEVPRLGLFDLGLLKPLLSLAGIAFPRGLPVTDPGLEYLKFRLAHNGRPLTVLSLGEVDPILDSVVWSR